MKKIAALTVVILIISCTILSGCNEQKAIEKENDESFTFDYKEFTEYDPNNKLEWDLANDNRLIFDNWKRSEPGYVYKPYSTQDFVLEYDIMITDSGGNGNMVGPGFSDTLDFVTQVQNGIFVVYYAGFPTGTPRLCIITIVDGEWEWGWGGTPPQPNRIPINLNTEYYIKVEKNGGLLTLSVFSDPTGTNHIPGSPKIIETSLSEMNFNYFYAVSTPNVGDWEWTSGWIEDFNVVSGKSSLDSDDDGLEDWKEIEAGTKVYDNDSDDDGLTDGQELNGWNVGDITVTDITDNKEYTLSTIVGGLTLDLKWGNGWDKLPEDVDGDGVSDIFSDKWKLSIPNFLERGDINGDGLTTIEDEELIFYLTPLMVKTDPLNEDTDGDTILDPQDPFPNTMVTKWEICNKILINLDKYPRDKIGGGKAVNLRNLIEYWYNIGYDADQSGGIININPNVKDPRNSIYKFDRDGDGISIRTEEILGTYDGINRFPGGNWIEYSYNDAIDSDHDGILDNIELLSDTNPVVSDKHKRLLAFVEAGPHINNIFEASVSVYLDVDDVIGLSEDGEAGWITFWICDSISAGIGYPSPVDAGFKMIKTDYEEEDIDLDGGLDAQIAFFSGNTVHFIPSLSVSLGAQACKFDMEKDFAVKSLALTTLFISNPGIISFLQGYKLQEWLEENLQNIIDGEIVDHISDAEINGAR